MKKELRGFALLMVLAFLLVLSLLIAPLATAVGQVSSATIALEKVPAKAEARAAAVNLVRYNIAKATNPICDGSSAGLVTPNLALSQGDLKVTSLKCTKAAESFEGVQTYRYWTFEVNYRYGIRGLPADLVFTGTAVQFVMSQGGFLDDYIYIVDIIEK